MHTAQELDAMTAVVTLRLGDIDQVDPVMAEVLEAERGRQQSALHLLAPSMLVPRAVGQCLNSSLGNLDGEGYVGRPAGELADYAAFSAEYRARGSVKYNPSGPVAEYVELLAGQRISAMLVPDRQAAPAHVNVQPVSGSIANMAVFRGLLDPGDTVVGLAPSSGGHLSHGAPFHATGLDYRITHITTDVDGAELDLVELRKAVAEARPKLVVLGASSFPRAIDWRAVRAVLDEFEPRPILLADIAHFAGLVATGHYPNPIDWADVVTFVGYKTLGGPKSAVVATRSPELAKRIDRSLFPGMQGAPRLAEIAALGVAAHLARTNEFRLLIDESVHTAAQLAEQLSDRHGLRPAFGGTDSHMILLKECPHSPELARHLEAVGVLCNSNLLPGDTKPSAATGLRLGTVGACQRGLRRSEAAALADLLARAIQDHYRAGHDAEAIAADVRAFVHNELTA